MLPYDTSMSYWMMAIPRFEWQPEPPAAAAEPAIAPDLADTAPAACDSGEPALPRLRLVITGVNWVAVPFWTPRENAAWNAASDAARDEDRQRNDGKDVKARQPPEQGLGEAADGKVRP